jgi:metallophosphoesterase (TIGR00282 family)
LKILAIGDVTSPVGAKHLKANLPRIIKEENIDFTLINGENASFINGISKECAEELFLAGADAITGGNHTMANFGAQSFLEESERMLRPINYGDGAPGRGWSIIDTGKYRALVINAMGVVHIEPTLDSPYSFIDKALSECRGGYDVAILDIHAEATGEKLAIAHYFDGRINVVFSTHTHVPTADGRILPKGAGYISDLGMCGESGGILGMDPATVIYKMKNRMPGRFKAASGEPVADAVIFTVDDKTKKCIDIKRITF